MKFVIKNKYLNITMSYKHLYSPRTLIHNYFEDRNTSNYDNEHFKTNAYLKNHRIFIDRLQEVYAYFKRLWEQTWVCKSNFQKDKFGSSTDNWMKFQPSFTAKKEFKTIYQKEFKDPNVQKPKFSLRQTSLTGDIGKLTEYRFF